MERVDLQDITFDQAETLALVPGLKAKQLQNWNESGVIDSPNVGKGKKRLYSGLGVVGLRAMVRLVEFGIRPSEAAPLCNQVMERALALHDETPQAEGSSRPEFTVVAHMIDVYHRGYIYRFDDRHKMTIIQGDLGQLRLFLPENYHTIEVDLLIFKALNAIYMKLAGETPPEEPVVTGDNSQEALEIVNDSLAFKARLSAPRGREGTSNDEN
ncbi:hypothetical protein [Sinorhizobium sp. BJ1]|uniref:hypothetical protein n=1 Tax=Sinorhizobium sp. BJ1 TaxID=2035455 RepID=UPI000BE98BC2|nr:hypothetical protein [Sinorhizobium sp. BJ1]PDT85781.1 hypothetical protein CO676_02355 [Sinorhizobium sp. BJ1]